MRRAREKVQPLQNRVGSANGWRARGRLGAKMAAECGRIYELTCIMRSFLAFFLVLAAVWHVKAGGTMYFGEAMLAIAAAWFVSLFVAD